MCNLVIELPDGKFTFKPNYGWSLIREVKRSGGAFTVSSNDKVVGFACLRSSLIPVPEDLVALKAGYSLTIAGEDEEDGMVYLEAVDGKITVKTDSAALSNKDRQTFDATIAKMQAELVRSAATQP